MLIITIINSIAIITVTNTINIIAIFIISTTINYYYIYTVYYKHPCEEDTFENVVEWDRTIFEEIVS